MKIAVTIALVVAAIGWGSFIWLDSGMCVLYKVDRVRSDFPSIRSALQTYRINAGRYPTTEQGLRALVVRPNTDPIPKDWAQIHSEVPKDAWQREYQYRLIRDEPDPQFELRSLGPDGIDGTQDDQSGLDGKVPPRSSP